MDLELILLTNVVDVVVRIGDPCLGIDEDRMGM